MNPCARDGLTFLLDQGSQRAGISRGEAPWLDRVRMHSLRFKLSCTNAILISLVFMGLGLVRYRTVSYRVHRNFDERLLADARLLVASFQVGPAGRISRVPPSAPAGAPSATASTQPPFVITDRAGRLVARDLYDRYMLELMPTGIFERKLSAYSGFSNLTAPDSRTLRFVSIPIVAGQNPSEFTLHVGRPLDSLRAVLNEYWLIYFYSLPLILFASAGVSWLLVGRALRPFKYVAAAATRTTSENLHRRLEIPYTESEVAGLVTAFNEMVERLNRSFEQMRRFNADTAHELRTPLAVLLAQTELALRSPGLPEETRALLSSNLEELDRMICFVNEILTLSEAEAGAYKLAPKPINLRSVVRETVEGVSLLAQERGVRLEIEDGADVWLEADVLWIRRAILNVLDNAIKYSHEGGTVQVRVHERDGSAVFRITDQGIGISSRDLPLIFDRLYRADHARSRTGGGSGLGLSLVKWIVEAHHGKIHVSSHPEQGTDFEVELPLVASPPSENRDTADSAPAPVGRLGGQTSRDQAGVLQDSRR